MSIISKSKYCLFLQCPKLFWLSKYKPELAEVSDTTEALLATGTEVGDLAKRLFGDYVDVTVRNDDGLDFEKMIENTKREICNGTDVICEAAFSGNGLYCAVDILKKDGVGYLIYEVKSSTQVKDAHIPDAAFQKYALEQNGIKIKKVYIVHLNKNYVRNGELNIKELFEVEDISDLIINEYNAIPANIKKANKILMQKSEPTCKISEHCFCPYGCAYWKYCTRTIPSPSVFDVYRMPMNKKFENYDNGVITFNDLLQNNVELNDIQKRQIDFYLNDRKPYINKEKIKEFLSTLSFPLYFLDFETILPVVPQYDGTRPNQQVPFQYSLHYIESENGELKHKEFLADANENPLRPIAESLCKDIPMNVCVTAYNKSFECSRIQELADMFPDLSEHLINIKDNIKDFLAPFFKGYFYNKTMGRSFSIKSVLPALFPNDPALDYHNLKGCVHNGGEAMTIFPKLKYMDIEEQNRVRESLLRYCELDTFAMVKVWETLKEAAK